MRPKARARTKRLVGDVIAVVALTFLSLVRWGNATEEVGMYLPLVRALAGTWPAPEDVHLELLRRLPLNWCHFAAPFEAHGVLLDALFAEVVIGRALLVASAIALGATLCRRAPLRYAGAFVVALTWPWALTPARFLLLQPEALPACLAMPLALLAGALAVRRRAIAAGLALGIAADLHPVQALMAEPAVALALWLSSRESARRRRLLVQGAAFALGAAPTIVPLVVSKLTEHRAALPLGETYRLLEVCIGAHVFASRFDAATWSEALALVAGVLALAPAPEGRRARRALGTVAILGVAVGALGLALADLHLLPLLGLQLCFARAAVFSKALVLVFAGEAVLRARGWRAIGAALVVGGLLECQAVAAIGFAVLALEPFRERGRSAASLAVAGAAIVLGAASAALFLGSIDPEAPGSCVARALFVAAAIAGAGRLASRARPRTRERIVAAAALVAGVLAFHVVFAQPGARGVFIRRSRLDPEPHMAGAAEREALGAFLARETPRDAVLLLPPEERFLLYRAGRSVVAAAHWGTLTIWDPVYGKGELERLHAIGYDFDGERERSQRAYQAWAPAEIKKAARSVGATHVVIDRTLGDPDLGAPLYDSPRFRVYAVPRS